MDYNKLFLFINVVDYQSFSEAGRQLGVPKSNISRKVGELEEELGCRLLERSTRRLRLTVAGRKLYYRSAPLLEQLKATEDEIVQEQVTPKGVLRIVSFMEFGIFFLSKIVIEYMQKYPDVIVDIELTNQQIDLFKKPVDILFQIGVGTLPDSSITASWMASSPTGIFASRGFIQKHGVPKTPKDLKNFPCVCFKKAESTWYFETNGKRTPVNVSGPLIANNVTFLLRGVLNGIGIGYLPKPFFYKDFIKGNLVELLPETPPLPINFYAYLPSHRHRSYKVTTFLDFCKGKVSELIEIPVNS